MCVRTFFRGFRARCTDNHGPTFGNVPCHALRSAEQDNDGMATLEERGRLDQGSARIYSQSEHDLSAWTNVPGRWMM